ncbi:galactose mutarotase-like protein [Wallemia mellicola]|nr:galactose mutarotase-like protein [Wallemia mellicola]
MISKENKEIKIVHSSGNSVVINKLGATITSFKDAHQKEHLFLSNKLIPGKAIRGGIPIAFPVFGKLPTSGAYSDLPQHGYARISEWTYDETPVMDNDDGVSVRFILESPPKLPPARLIYTVTLTAHQLTSTLHVKNTSSTDVLPFQALLHTYYAGNPNEVGVKGLNGVRYSDKTTGGETRIESNDVVYANKNTDSVYMNTTDEIHLTNGIKIRKHNLPDTVIWNPSEGAKSMADMHEGGWNEFICVEPGHVRDFYDLVPGKEWIGFQVITI